MLLTVNKLSITLYILIALLNIVSFAIALYIAYKTWRISRIIKDSALEIVALGFIVLSIGLILSFIAATLSAINISYPSSTPCPHLYGEKHSYSKWGYHEPPPWSGYRSYWSWSTIMFSGIVYPIAYLLIFVGLRKEYLSITGIEEEWGTKKGFVSTVLFSPIYLYGLVGEASSITLLFFIIYYVLKSNSSSWLGYFALMISHVLRLVAILSDNPWIFLIGEIARPLGLIIIMLGLVKKP